MNSLNYVIKKTFLMKVFFCLKFNVMKKDIELLWKNFITNNTRRVNEKIPKKGDLNIITNWNKVPQAIILTTKIELIKFNEITAKFAQREGEGDKSLAYWKKVHKAYFKREMQGYKEKFSKDMIIVCQYFNKIYS